MTTSVVAGPRVHARPEQPHTQLEPAASALTSEALIDCPACGLPATVESRDLLAGTSGPEVHLMVRCPVGRHWSVWSGEGL